jgi:hypothetical protein
LKKKSAIFFLFQGSKEGSKGYMTYSFEQVVSGDQDLIDAILWAIGLLLCSTFDGIIKDKEGNNFKDISLHPVRRDY